MYLNKSFCIIPGDTDTFLEELNQQIKLLKDNGKVVRKEIDKNKVLIDDLVKAAASAGQLIKAAIKSKFKLNKITLLIWICF